jgi:hypothetical protein
MQKRSSKSAAAEVQQQKCSSQRAAAEVQQHKSQVMAAAKVQKADYDEAHKRGAGVICTGIATTAL